MPFTVYDGFIKALQFNSFGTLGIEVIFSALTPLGFTTASAIQAVTGFVVGSPVVGYSSAGYPIHYSFLAAEIDDPRPQLLKELQEVLGSQGSIVAYNAGFEDGVLGVLVKAFPEYTNWFEDILVRIVDLLIPFRNSHYYNASQKDTASLKKVLPAITGKGYEEMEIGAGMDASIAFERITYGNVTQEEISRVRADLLNYCRLDTEGMIWIVDKLRELVNI